MPREKLDVAGFPSRPSFDCLMKVLLIGDTAVGKSCLLLRFADDRFTSSFVTTIGIDFRIKTIDVGDKRVKVQVWDTAGQERFRTITRAYYRDAMGILLVYDVTDVTTFHNIRTWVQNISENAKEECVKMLIGNKCDCENKRVVSYECGKQLASANGMKFMETSAKTGHNVMEAFQLLARSIVNGKMVKWTANEGSVDLDETLKKRRACCNGVRRSSALEHELR